MTLSLTHSHTHTRPHTLTLHLTLTPSPHAFSFTPLIHTSYSHLLFTPLIHTPIHTSFSHLTYTTHTHTRAHTTYIHTRTHIRSLHHVHTFTSYLVHTHTTTSVLHRVWKSDPGRPSSQGGPSVWCGIQACRAQAPWLAEQRYSNKQYLIFLILPSYNVRRQLVLCSRSRY